MKLILTIALPCWCWLLAKIPTGPRPCPAQCPAPHRQRPVVVCCWWKPRPMTKAGKLKGRRSQGGRGPTARPTRPLMIPKSINQMRHYIEVASAHPPTTLGQTVPVARALALVQFRFFRRLKVFGGEDRVVFMSPAPANLALWGVIFALVVVFVLSFQHAASSPCPKGPQGLKRKTSTA
jgi:hypothetical protein